VLHFRVERGSNTYIDYENKFLITNMISDVIFSGRVRGICIMFLGRNSIVVLNINLLEDSYEAYLQDVMYIINSFKFERGYEYKE
jgi:hypothetical protein